jgi:hypothetical protein
MSSTHCHLLLDFFWQVISGPPCIKERLLNVCEDRNITVPKIVALITDNGVNITKASAELVGKSRNLPCFSHTLNLVASKVCDIENIAPLVSSVKAIVPFFRRSVPTRWNSTYFMLRNKDL